MTATIRRKEKRSIIQLQSTQNTKYYAGEANPHYYSVKAESDLLCLVIYNRRQWTPADVPLRVVTSCEAICNNLARRELVDEFVSAHVYDKLSRDFTESVYVDLQFNASICELKTWLDEFAQLPPDGPPYAAQMMNQPTLFSKIATIFRREETKVENLGIDREVSDMQKEIAAITANAGQNLRTAYSHATRPIGAQIWDTQYYNFPE